MFTYNYIIKFTLRCSKALIEFSDWEAVNPL